MVKLRNSSTVTWGELLITGITCITL